MTVIALTSKCKEMCKAFAQTPVLSSTLTRTEFVCDISRRVTNRPCFLAHKNVGTLKFISLKDEVIVRGNFSQRLFLL